MSFSKDVKKELSKINNLVNKKEVEYEFYGYLASNNISKEKLLEIWELKILILMLMVKFLILK